MEIGAGKDVPGRNRRGEETEGAAVQERGESYYNPQLPATVEALAAQGIIADSDGAKVVWTEETEGVPPLMVQKSDGGYGYARCASTSLCCCSCCWTTVHRFPVALQ